MHNERALVLLMAVGCTAAARPPSARRPAPRLEAESLAISRAEEFVRVNGYVARQDADPSRVVRESCCSDGAGIQPILAHRAGTLLGGACAVISEDARTDLELIQSRGRAVVMDLEGKELRIVHQDIDLDAPGAKPLPGMRTFDDLLRKEGGASRPADGPR